MAFSVQPTERRDNRMTRWRSLEKPIFKRAVSRAREMITGRRQRPKGTPEVTVCFKSLQ